MNNPLVMIKKLCKKEDYVVFKVLASVLELPLTDRLTDTPRC
jgi:hypothetical protein